MRNNVFSDNKRLEEGRRILSERLPDGWRVELEKGAKPSVGARLRIIAPDRSQRTVVIETKGKLDPRGVSEIENQFRSLGADDRLVVASYLSPATRERLRAASISYIDLTGNVRIAVSKPGLFIDTGGADVDPKAVPRGSRSLRGERAGRVIRNLIDHRVPAGVRQLAAQTGVDPGYVSRVLALLDRETLIERKARGKIVQVDWQRLLRRWAQEAPLATRGVLTPYLAPRGAGALIETLGDRESATRTDYAVTGSFAAVKMAPVAAPRVLTLYSTTFDAASELGLRITDSGANVLLVQPSDPSVLLGARVIDGVRYVAVSQVAVDLLGGTGREPAEGEALIEWMVANEESWRG
ncbi:MAG: hypothetical protein H0U13_09300 [Gemmatimonadaceae bacterium]|nr:hypothetical protein [Gemmatimonadaceae bacterium]